MLDGLFEIMSKLTVDIDTDGTFTHVTIFDDHDDSLPW